MFVRKEYKLGAKDSQTFWNIQPIFKQQGKYVFIYYKYQKYERCTNETRNRKNVVPSLGLSHQTEGTLPATCL